MVQVDVEDVIPKVGPEGKLAYSSTPSKTIDPPFALL
jgi:hypothetical protein